MAKIVHIDQVHYDPKSVVTVGTFDGVHLGHRAIMETLVQKAKEQDCRSVVITFDPHPRDIINPTKDAVELLTTIEERAEVLQEYGIDELVIIPFTRDFSLLSSRDFVVDYVFNKIGVTEFVIGYDHQFGKDREGTIDTVEKVGAEYGFEAYVVSKKEMGTDTISSSVIRRMLKNDGDVKKAASFLGRNLKIKALVTHGDERGRKIGYPTANLAPEHPKKIIPKNGVYAVNVDVNGKSYGGMMNIGVRPTFDGFTRTLEVHILNFDDIIYGKTLNIEFIDRIRDEKKFNGVEELVDQLDRDKTAITQILDGTE